MIIEAIITLISVVFKVIFAWINLPSVPAEIVNSIDAYLDLVFNNLSFLGFFVRPVTFRIVATSAIAIFTFNKLYKVTMWIYHKLPISSN